MTVTLSELMVAWRNVGENANTNLHSQSDTHCKQFQELYNKAQELDEAFYEQHAEPRRMRRVYMSHDGREEEAHVWLRHLRQRWGGEASFAAPYLAGADPAQCQCALEMCDEIWLVGAFGTPRQWALARHAISKGIRMVNMTGVEVGA